MSSLLIVDDYEPTRRGIRSLLRGRPDWQICGEATDGLDAVEMAKLLRPDCILMDVTMPRLNGLEATRLILEQAPRTRVVIVTQNDPSVARLQAEGAGACGFVAKSELDDELIPAIEAALSSSGGSVALAP
jgi:DNA-binding NarL/FixJ family response regulator